MEGPWWTKSVILSYSSPFYEYYYQRSGQTDYKQYHNIDDIMQTVIDHIRAEKMYDPRNTSIAILGEPLEKLLNVKYCAISDLYKFMNRHFGGRIPVIDFNKKSERTYLVDFSDTDETIRVFKKNVLEDFKLSDMFVPSKELREVMFSIETSLDPNQEAFRLKDIFRSIKLYLLVNKTRLYDIRNMNVAIIKGELLEKAFKCMCFKSQQLATLVLSELEPV